MPAYHTEVILEGDKSLEIFSAFKDCHGNGTVRNIMFEANEKLNS